MELIAQIELDTRSKKSTTVLGSNEVTGARALAAKNARNGKTDAPVSKRRQEAALKLGDLDFGSDED